MLQGRRREMRNTALVPQSARTRTHPGAVVRVSRRRPFFLPERGAWMVHKTEDIRIRVAPAEKALARRLAAIECQNVSEWVRGAIRQRARACGMWPPAEMATQQGQRM